MADNVTSVTCGQCGKILDEPSNIGVANRIPCPECGSKSRHFSVVSTAEVKLKSQVTGKARSGEAGKPGGKPWLKLKAEESWSTRYQKWMQREKTENRRDNRYTEIVKDPDTGKIIHAVDEPLTEHRGHGSAKQKKAPNSE